MPNNKLIINARVPGFNTQQTVEIDSQNKIKAIANLTKPQWQEIYLQLVT